jgi:glycosyltransferase involved in cell wall biosynthesis
VFHALLLGIPLIKIHFDDIIYQLQRTGGASVYWREMTGRIAASEGVRLVRTRGASFQRLLPVPTTCDIFHSSYFRIGAGRARRVATVHDLSYELGYLRDTSGFLGNAVNILERRMSILLAHGIICVSENTRSDLVKIYPKEVRNTPIAVIYHGYLASAGEPANETGRILDLLHITGGKFVLFVGSRAGYKGFDAALTGFSLSALAQQGYYLVCVGGPLSQNEVAQAERLGIGDRVKTISFATNDELKSLYGAALALVYPSRYEGFGIPPLEAMALGCPAIVANVSSLPEVVGNAAYMVDPNNPIEISHALHQLLDSNERARMIALGRTQSAKFSWDKCAQQHLAFYRQIARQ